MFLKVDFETGEEHVIGGFTELKEYIDQGLHEEGDKEAGVNMLTTSFMSLLSSLKIAKSVLLVRIIKMIMILS